MGIARPKSVPDQAAASGMLQAVLNLPSRSVSPEKDAVPAAKSRSFELKDGSKPSENACECSSATLKKLTDTCLPKDVRPWQQSECPDSDKAPDTSSTSASHQVSTKQEKISDATRQNPWKAGMNAVTPVVQGANNHNTVTAEHQGAGPSRLQLSTAMWLMVQGNVSVRERISAVDRLKQAIAARQAQKKAGMLKKALLSAEAKA